MKKLYFLLFTILISSASFGQTTVFTESFETDGNGTRYTTSQVEFSDFSPPSSGGGDIFGRTNLNNTSEDVADLAVGTFYSVSSTDGDFCFAAMDLDAANASGSGGSSSQTLTFTGIDISGNSNLTLAMLLAEDDDGSTNQDWDGSDGIIIEVQVDGGGYSPVLAFESAISTNGEPQQDTDFDGVGDGIALTSMFQEFTASLTSGNTLDIRITFDFNSGDEDVAIDNIRVIDGFVANPGISITAPSNGTELDPGTTNVDLTWSTTNLGGSETVNVTVNGTPTMNATSPFSITTVDGQTYNVTVDLVDGGVLDTDMTSFSIKQINTVASIADLRMGTVGDFYTLTGEGVLTFQQSSRNQKYIEDSPGNSMSEGILIDDSAGTITTIYSRGDGISGITGQLSDFGGTLQFVPSSDPGTASSTGNTLNPQAVTLAQLTSNAEDYESELVIVSGVTMDNTTANFASNSVHGLTQSTDMFDFRSSFTAADYVTQGATVPTTMGIDITGIVSERFGPYYFTARDAADFSIQILSNDDFNRTKFSIYPNPTSTGEVTISSLNSTDMSVAVFDILGKQVKKEVISNNRLNVSNLKPGIYILRITQDNATSTKKLVIK